jgi:predicted ATP-dependent endonuclease of OLD family
MQAAQKLENQRNSSLINFDARLFQIEKKKDEFDKLLNQVLGQDFDWAIEQRDSGNYYIKCKCQNVMHSSEGIGDGIWSIFTICAALFDSEPESVIVIDEPELSVHPALQKKLMRLLLSYSGRMQIIISTHSPYFIDWEAITNGAQLMRVVKEGANSKCYSITEYTRTAFKNLMRDINNPHVLGIEANEALFLGDNIILVEGQEDVVILNKICKDLKLELNGDFYGWGVGGAHKMGTFLLLFQELGYKHVVAILDGNKKEEAERLKSKFQQYKIITLKTDDIRDKEEKKIKGKEGITTTKGEIKPEYVEYAESLIAEINNSFQL